MRRLIALTIAAPRRSLAAMLLFVCAVSTGVVFLKFDFSPQQVYGGQQDVVDFSEEHKELFRFEDSIALVLLEATDDRSLIRPDALAWMKRLSDKAATIPGITDVSSLVALDMPRVNIRQMEVQWTPLIPETRFDDVAWLERRLDRLPLLNDLLVSQDRQLTLTLLTLDPDGRDINTTREYVTGLRTVLEEVGTPKGTRISLSGVPVIRVDIIGSLINDQLVMTPISACLFIVIAVFMYRSWKVTAISLLSVMTAVGMTLGIMGWSGMTFSILSNIVPTLVMIIGAANCVHIIGRLQGMLRDGVASVDECVRRVMVEMSKTCLLTLATTAIGFGSLLMARSELLQLLAIQSALGMVCNYICLMLILAPGLALTLR
jgi:predicted RND superfamily exporter protein